MIASLALHLVRASRRSDDELIQRFQQEMRALEGERKRMGGQLSQQLTALNDQTRSLSEALRRPGVRGRWGELTLRNVVEAAAMSEHCDFSTQEHLADSDGAIRPDLVVRLPGRGRLTVDAKVPLDSYLDALEAESGEEQTRLLDAHARSVRQKVKQLAHRATQAASVEAPRWSSCSSPRRPPSPPPRSQTRSCSRTRRASAS
jgi:DNA recombination protein RmuC